MNIELERIQRDDHKYITVLLNLYLDSFPGEERRELNSLLSMLDEKSMYFSAVLSGTELVGFVVYWVFEDFRYIEHLAVLPDHRREGIGSWILQKLQQKGEPILLEVEIPHDDTSFQRVGFYNRSGFYALSVTYSQPPYREGESLLPMMLFSDQPNWEPETLRRCIELFHYRVYNFRLKG
jgi:ribosomal protein S18 acetylase RimI-like enzyme